MAFKMNARSPLMKQLKGGQKNLPQALKSAIEAAPESPAKAKFGPGVRPEAGKTGTAGSTPKASTPKASTPKASTPKASKPKYDKELNGLVASRKGLKKGTPEYNKVQNQINAKLGSSVRRKVEPAKKAATTPKISNKQAAQFESDIAKGNAKAPMGSEKKSATQAPKAKIPAVKKENKSVKVKQTAAGTTMTTKAGGGANKGGTTTKQKVTKNKEKTVIKDKDTRTVIKRSNKGARITETKTTKRLGKGRIKEALANRKAKRDERKEEKAAVSSPAKNMNKGYGMTPAKKKK